MSDWKYHTCGRCKWGDNGDKYYPCNKCRWGVDQREDLWEPIEKEDGAGGMQRGYKIEWISVSEELPKNEQKVLFGTKQGEIHQGIYCADNRWYSSILSTWIYFDSIIVWMPLPTPYEPQKSEEK